MCQSVDMSSKLPHSSSTSFKGTKHIPERYLPSLATSCENMASQREGIMEKIRAFQIVCPTNLCKHSTTCLARGTVTNERKQSVLLIARSFKHSKTTRRFFVFNLSSPSR